MYVVQLCTYLDLADFLFSFLFFSWHIAFRWEVVGNKGPSCLLLVHECERTRSTLLTCIYIISKNQKRGTLFVPKTACISLSFCQSLRLSSSLFFDLNPNPRAAFKLVSEQSLGFSVEQSLVFSTEQSLGFSAE
mgnify:FL=1